MNIRGKNNWTIIAIVAVLLVMAGVIPVTAIPDADFTNTTPRSGTVPLTVSFNDQSNGEIISYAWDFDNDGSVDNTSTNPSYTYNTVGGYTVNLTVTDSEGPNSEVKVDYITVNPAPPVAAFTNATPRSGTAPLTVTFTDQSTGSITSHSWNFGDGGTSTDADTSHQYTAVGTYSVNLTVIGPGGSDFENKTNYITVDPAPPVAAFTNATPRSGTAPLTVTFTDQSTGSITSHAWDFNNDGTNESTLANPLPYTYTTAGVYTVKLTVTGPGGSSTKTEPNYISVGEVPPVAGFSGAPLSGPKPLNVQFSDESTGVINTYEWDFGDGKNNSTNQNPSHQYTAMGSYTVTLTVTGPGGSDFETKSNYIIVGDTPPIAGFSGTPTSGQKPLNVQFTDASTGNITSYAWNFGDGKTSTLKNPSNPYTTAGSYTVNLTVTGPGGIDLESKTNYITVTNATTKIGIYKDGIWYLDVNGNGGKGTDSDKEDYFGATGWTSVVGDWNGDGNKMKIGVYKDGVWYLDWNGSGAWDQGTDKEYYFGALEWTPVVGDWNPAVAGNKIGVYQNGIWYLDWNGSGAWDAGTDKEYYFGAACWTPVVGDWNPAVAGNKIGVYQNGVWYLDWNGNGMWDAGTDKEYYFGAPGWTPVVGDWNPAVAGNKIGVYQNGVWYLDWNGNGMWDAGTDKEYYFGDSVWISVVGDWNGDGKGTKIGVYKDGVWYLDYNGDGAFSSGVNTAYTFRGEAGWTPTVGDWDGSGTTKVGVYKNEDGLFNQSWYLDYNGDGVWDGGDNESHITRELYSTPIVGDWNGNGKTKVGYYKQGIWHLNYNGNGTFNYLGSFFGATQNNFIPVVGDWNGNKITKIGVYKDGDWYLDMNGNGVWDGSTTDRRVTAFGLPGGLSVVGDWNGDGTTKIGVYRATDGAWRLDYDGNGVWNATIDKEYIFGTPGSIPTIGDWNGDGKSKIGWYKDGTWKLDYNGNGAWDAGTDKEYSFGATGWIPVVGKWS